MGIDNGTKRDIVVVSGMYRCGTSIVWRVLSEDGCFKKKYYEPLHPDLYKFVEDGSIVGNYIDDKKILYKLLNDFHLNKFRLQENESYDELKEYLSKILKPMSITKFTRVTLRLAWLLKNFPGIFIVNLIRDPRAVCYSYMKRGNLDFLLKKENNMRKLKFKAVYMLPNLLTRAFLPRNLLYWHQEYLDYLQKEEKWKRYIKQFKYSKLQTRIMALWRVNVEQSIEDLNRYENSNFITIRFEDFVSEPEKTLGLIYNKIGFQAVPDEVMKGLYRDTKKYEHVSHHKYSKGLSRDLVSNWKTINNDIWQESIAESQITGLMNKLGYQE